MMEDLNKELKNYIDQNERFYKEFHNLSDTNFVKVNRRLAESALNQQEKQEAALESSMAHRKKQKMIEYKKEEIVEATRQKTYADAFRWDEYRS